MERPSPYRRTDFKVFSPQQTRWSDNDTYGHMNNVIHYLMFDTAVNGWLIDRGLLDIRNGETIGLVVETGCRYFREIMFPDVVHAGIRVARLGNSSVTYEVALFANEDEEAAAQGHFVHVYVDAKTRRPKPLADDWRATLQEICQ